METTVLEKSKSNLSLNKELARDEDGIKIQLFKLNLERSQLNILNHKREIKNLDAQIKELSSRQRHIKNTRSIQADFEPKEKLKLVQSCKEGETRGCIARDTEGRVYVDGHGNIDQVEVTDSEGNVTTQLVHSMYNTEGESVNTREYIESLIANGTIGPKDEVYIVSCHINDANPPIDFDRFRGVKRVSPVVSGEGEVSVVMTDQTHSNSVIGFSTEHHKTDELV